MNPRVVGANLFVKLMQRLPREDNDVLRACVPDHPDTCFRHDLHGPGQRVNFHLCVQDLDQSKSSKESIQALEVEGKFKITQVDPAVNATQYVRDNKVNLVLVIPKGFGLSLTRRRIFNDFQASVTVTYIYDPSSSSVSTKIDILNGVLAGVNQELSGIPPFIKSVTKSILTRKYRFIEYFIPGIIAMAVMTLSLFGTVNLNTELRQKGIIRKLSTTPITRTDWILSDILYQFIIAVVSTTAMLLVSYAVFNANLHIDAWLPAFILLDVFAFVGIGMILARFAREAQSAAAAGTPSVSQ